MMGEGAKAGNPIANPSLGITMSIAPRFDPFRRPTVALTQRLREKFIPGRHDSASSELRRCPAVFLMSEHSARNRSRDGD
jgi:hypothetical protein